MSATGGIIFQFVTIIAYPILITQLSLRHSDQGVLPPLGRSDRKIAKLRLEHEIGDVWGVLMLSACSFGTSYRPLARLTVGPLSFFIMRGYIPYHQINGGLGWKNHPNERLFSQ